jgi:hypothetical protein
MAAGSTSGGGSEGIKAGRAYVEIGVQDAGLKAGLNAAKKAVLKLGKETAEAGAPALGLGAAIMAPILESLKEVVEHFSEINRASIRTGASTEAISDLGYAAKASGASLEDVERGLKFLHKNMQLAGEGSKVAEENLAAFGLTVKDLKGKDADQQFLMIAEGLDRIEESAQGPALQRILGRGGVGLRPMLDNSRELARLLKENGEVGGRVSKQDAENAEKVEKAYVKTSAAVKNAFLAIGAAILPHADTIDKLSTAMVGGVSKVKAFIDGNRDAVLAVLGIGGAIAAAGAALVGLGLALSVASVAIGGFTAAAGAIGTVFGVVFSPVGLAAAAAVAASILAIAILLKTFPDLLGDIKEGSGKIWGDFGDTFKTAWAGIKDALAEGDFELAWEIMLTGAKLAFQQFVAGILASFEVLWETIKKRAKETGSDAALALKKPQEEGSWTDSFKVLWKEFKFDVLGGPAPSDLPDPLVKAGGKTFLSQEDQRLADAVKSHTKAMEDIKKAYDDALKAINASESDTIKKLKEELAALRQRARPAPREAGPMPREIARKAAEEGLGSARGQFGGYGAGAGLRVSGEAIQKDQLKELEAINVNTQELGGVRAF